ncbi:unnamed protein product [Euphydryas editha]|uniref:Peptidase S1 domain-containing protein n=1 Tax=Euphydryas editha TaxID=104508 RepID=A0AAU9U972_EUPED|nr:unnamed protein product [Euphydryas editha]
MASTSVQLIILICLSFTSNYSKGRYFEAKIVEGEYVQIRNYPHAVFLEMVNGDSSSYICGASVLNQYYLVSVAHCFINLDENGQVKAFAGHENVKKANVIRNGKPIIHSHFDTYTVQNDIALLLLDKPLPLGKHIQRVIIKKNFPRKVTGSVAGWGIINEVTEEETILLKSVTQTLKGRSDCLKLDLKPGMFCAGSLRSSDPRPAS